MYTFRHKKNTCTAK